MDLQDQLSDDQVQQFKRNGYISARFFTVEEMSDAREAFFKCFSPGRRPPGPGRG